MASPTKILKTRNGITLTEVHLIGQTGTVAIAYVVTSNKTPETKSSANREEAERFFDEWINT